MQRAFALYAALIDNRHPVSRDVIERRIYRLGAEDQKRSTDWFETSFKRDRALLRELGIHVVHVRESEREGYVIDRSASFARDDFVFEIDEASSALLYLALTGMTEEPLFPLARDLRLAQLRLARLWQSVYGDDGIIAISNRPADETVERQAHHAQALLQAILQTRTIEMTYRNVSGTRTERRLAPYGLSFFEDRWYVVGHDSLSDAIRIFALARIESMSAAKDTFVHPEDFRIGDYLTLPFMLGDAHPQGEVTLLIDESRTWQLPAITRGKGATVTQADGSHEWTVAYTDLDELVRYIIDNELCFVDACGKEATYLGEKLKTLIGSGS